MLAEFSLIAFFATSLVLFVTYFVFKLLISPYLGILYYKRQGATPIFHWKLMFLADGWKNAKQKDDFFYIYRQSLKKDSKTKVFVENLLTGVNLVLVDPEMIKEFLQKYDVYHKDLSLTGLLVELGKGTIGQTEGSEWKKRRKMLSGAFNFEFLKNIIPMIVDVTEENFAQWIKSNELKNQNLSEKMSLITGEVTGRFVFGKDFSGKKLGGVPMTIGIQRLVSDISEEIISPSSLLLGTKLIHANILPRHKKLNAGVAEMRAICREMIAETERSKDKQKNLLNVLIDLRSGDSPDDRITDEDIIGEFVGFFVAGTDTTAHFVASALYFLWKNSDCLEKVRNEVDAEFSDVSTLDINNINKMNYTTASLKETLRLGGPASVLFGRMAIKDDEICGLKIKKGTLVNANFDLLLKSEKYFSNPTEFVPERWLDDPLYNNDGFKKEPYAFTPFSAGPRNCVGQHLALIEARIVLGMFIKTFNFSFSDDYKLVLTQRFVYEPLDPLLVTLNTKV